MGCTCVPLLPEAATPSAVISGRPKSIRCSTDASSFRRPTLPQLYIAQPWCAEKRSRSSSTSSIDRKSVTMYKPSTGPFLQMPTGGPEVGRGPRHTRSSRRIVRCSGPHCAESEHHTPFDMVRLFHAEGPRADASSKRRPRPCSDSIVATLLKLHGTLEY